TKSNWGGAQRYLYDLASNLPTSGWEVKVVAGGRGILTEKLQAAGIKTGTLPVLQKTSSLFRSLFSFVNFKAAWDLRKIIKEERPDVLHLNSSKIMGLGALAALGLKIRVVSTIHGWPFLEPRFFPTKALIFILSWLSALFQDKIILITKRDFNIAKKIIPSKKLNYIPNGIGPIDFLPSTEARAFFSKKTDREILPNETVIGTIAELTKNKGLEYLVEAAKCLIPNYKFLIIGEGREREKLESLITKYQLQNTVFLLGFIPEASRYLKGFDIFVLPSLKEGLPYTALEALAAGLPVVATEVGGLPDIAETAKSCFLVPPGNPEALAAAMEKLISEKKGRNNAGGGPLENSLQNMVSKTIQVYQ
ncbi:MAG: glycosyltransferase, partial [bacterium]|nr:glycosyltransferase [bacterium]